MAFPFTNRELDLMAVLWERGSATVSEVQERLEDELAYSTVLTTLRNMEEKGYVSHTEEDRAFRYRPVIRREEAGRGGIQKLVQKVFGGSWDLMLTHLVSRTEFTEEELERLGALLEERIESSPKSQAVPTGSGANSR